MTNRRAKAGRIEAVQYIGVKYVRASEDGTGRAVSVASQEDEGDEFFAEHGIKDAGTCKDNDQSASLYTKEGRPGYERVLEMLQSGQANLLWTYSSSRAQRNLAMYTRLRDVLIEIGGFWAYGGRIYDMSDPTDRKITARDALEAEGAADSISSEVLRGVRKRAKSGLHSGPIPYGYRLTYDRDTGESLGLAVDAQQAEVVREIVNRLLEREPVTRVMNDLNARGVPPQRSGRWDKRLVVALVADHERPAEWKRLMERLSPQDQQVAHEAVAQVAAGESPKLVARALNRSGVKYFFASAWDSSKVRNIALSAAVAGLRVHRGLVLTTPVEDGSGEVTLVPIRTQWDAIITQEEHTQLVAILNAPGRRTNKDGLRVKHLWSGIARCGVCESPLIAKPAHDKCGGYRRYACRGKGCVVRNKDLVDAWLLELALLQLEREDAAQLFRMDQNITDAHAAQQELEVLSAELEGWRAASRQGTCSLESFLEIEPGLLERIKRAEVRAKRATLPPVLAEVMGPDARTAFLGLELTEQRSILRAIMRPRLYRTNRRFRNGAAVLDTSAIDPGFLYSTELDDRVAAV